MRALAALLGAIFIFVGCFVLFGGFEAQFLPWITGSLSVVVGAYFVYWGFKNDNSLT